MATSSQQALGLQPVFQPTYDVFMVLWGKGPAFSSLGVTGSLLLPVTRGWGWSMSIQEVFGMPLTGRVGIRSSKP